MEDISAETRSLFAKSQKGLIRALIYKNNKESIKESAEISNATQLKTQSTRSKTIGFEDLKTLRI